MADVMNTFIENQANISGNNATIAENQRKVYEAGIRAGLAQDPDYAEGYEDGLDAALGGVEWQDILNGNTPVGRAIEADHATEADHSSEADHSKTASFSTEANHAATSDNATNANRSTEATHSEAADHATEATHASEADHSAESSHAANADYATNAGHATTATSAMSATNAVNATNAAKYDGIVTGTYVGDGTFVDRTLSFDFEPKLVIVRGADDSEDYPLVLVRGANRATSQYVVDNSLSSNVYSQWLVVEWGAKSVTWGKVGDGGHPKAMKCDRNKNYYYVAIG